jgi:SNF2 family DNA or RNA helicase
MKDHQLKALKRMEDLEKRSEVFFNNIKVKTNMAVLCDKVGAGKSIMILGTISNNIVLNKLEDVQKVYVNSMYPFDICVSKPKNNLSHRSNVIVVPKSIVQQWETYILNFTNLNYIKLTTFKDLEKFNTDPDIILLTNNIHNDFAVKFSGHIFSRMIYDEVDSIKIPSAQMIDANFYWFVSASITNIVYSRINHVGFIKTSLSTLNSVNIEYLFVISVV